MKNPVFIRFIGIFIIFFYLLSCNPKKDSGYRNAVIVFFSPDCPVCQLNILEIRRIDTLKGKDLKLELIFTKRFENKAAVQRFMDSTLPGITWKWDDGKLATKLEAKVYPEAFLIDSKGNTQYRGAIDDRFPGPGIKKTKAQQHYLADAIVAYLNHRPIQTKATDAFGCSIE